MSNLPFLKNIKKRLSEIVYSLTGIDTPFFGISWIPPVKEATVAQSFVTSIEDKRVLYQIYAWEVAGPVLLSVNNIRQEIGSSLKQLNRSSKLAKRLIVLQQICREFLNVAEPIVSCYDSTNTGFLYSLGFFSALGEFREKFWKLVAEIVSIYDLEISENLNPFLTESAIGDIIVKGYVHIYTHATNGLEPTILLTATSGELRHKIWVLDCPPHLLRMLYGYLNKKATIHGVSIKDGEHIKVQSIKSYEEPMPTFQKVEQILARRVKSGRGYWVD